MRSAECLKFAQPGSNTVRLIVNGNSIRLEGSQNKLYPPPTAFETRGRNVTVCPESICYKQSNTEKVNTMEELSVQTIRR
jgi:hypothetical protein